MNASGYVDSRRCAVVFLKQSVEFRKIIRTLECDVSYLEEDNGL